MLQSPKKTPPYLLTYLHAIWSYKEQSYKEPALRFWKKNKEPALRILDLKNRFTFKERLSIEISGLKERLIFFPTLKLLKQNEFLISTLAFSKKCWNQKKNI